jgi:indole-3-glycerol phosphate synthase
MNKQQDTTGGGPPSILTGLIDQARSQLQRHRAVRDDAEIQRLAAATPAPRDFAAALRGPGLSVIAELKRRSPSKGLLTSDYRPAERARAYQEGGAAALSILTHEEGFGGSPDHLATVREHSTLPLLRKDFIVDEYQIWEARALGADAVLLIVAALSEERLRGLLELAGSLGMAALVETHDVEEVDTALACGASVIGVNHRDLRTFTIDRSLTRRARPRIGADCTLVAESGVRNTGDAHDLRRAGADAILVGETLMRTGDPAPVIKELRAV